MRCYARPHPLIRDGLMRLECTPPSPRCAIGYRVTMAKNGRRNINMGAEFTSAYLVDSARRALYKLNESGAAVAAAERCDCRTNRRMTSTAPAVAAAVHAR